MNELTAFLLGVGVMALAILPYLIGQRAKALKRRADEVDAKVRKRMPYIWKNGLEDTASINIKMLLEIKDFLFFLEREIEIQRQLIGSIRSGTYDSDQPAAERNGRVREAYAERR